MRSDSPFERAAGNEEDSDTDGRAVTDPSGGRVATGQGPTTSQECEAFYGVEVDSPGEVATLQRLAETNGVETVRSWASEGIPIDAMGSPSKMEAYRQRKDSPVPWDAERRNEQSKRRNRLVQRVEQGSPAGDTQVPDSVRDVVSSPGQPLDASVQRAMEDRMDEDFSDVQVHTGPKAAQAAGEINAKAFTVGNHVAFNSGEYDPGSPEGRHTIAHELAHVRQQTGGAVSMLPQDDVELEIDPDPELEQEAEETAQRVMSGGDLGIQRMDADLHVQRAPDDSGEPILSTDRSELTTAQEEAVGKFLRLEELSEGEIATVASLFGIEKPGEIRTAERRAEWIRANQKRITKVLPGMEANNEDRYPDWYEDPHEPDSLVLEFLTPEDDEVEMLRAHGETNQNEFWLIPPREAGGIDPEDVHDLTAAEVEKALALPEKPKYISKVTLPPETAARISTIKENFGNEGLWPQVELDQRIDQEAYEIIRTFETTSE